MSATDTKGKSTRRQCEALKTLQAELDLTDYGTTADGRKRRKLTQAERRKHTLQRKEMEKRDEHELTVQADDKEKSGIGNKRQRLRGKNVAFHDSVVRGSLIFGGVNDLDEDDTLKGLNNLLEDGGELTSEMNGMTMEEEGDIDELLDEDEDAKSESEIINSNDVDGFQEHVTNMDTATSSAEKNLQQKRSQGNTRSRNTYRLKNLKSYRLALRHGDALGAHARGLNKTAIGTLQQVAAAVPVAPQVYSSLGLVYENMLLDDDDRMGRPLESNTGSTDTFVEEWKVIQRHIKLATKAYGSYHVAALLYKKDFTLWLRAGDMALELAELHSTAFTLLYKDKVNQSHPALSVPLIEGVSPLSLSNHERERNKWLIEARDDYQAADNLKPPGITVPAKLAYVQMHLGNLSEALTILTDLKNQAQSITASNSTTKKNNSANKIDGVQELTERSELERSYSAWMLYADLMLRIGYECSQWNDGMSKIENPTFRRWLKKYSKSFDWKERRLQALCLAFEAAAGSASGRNIVAWVKDRATKVVLPRIPGSTGVWFADTYDHTDKLELNDEENDDDQNDTQDRNDPMEDGNTIIAEASLRAEDGALKNTINTVVDGVNKTSISSISAPSQSRDDASIFSIERDLLMKNNRQELEQFDQETSNMLLSGNPQLASERVNARTALVRKHKELILKLVGDHHAKKSSSTSQEVDFTPLPMSASFETVCNIAYQLMKVCLDLQLPEGGKLTAEATLHYFRERIARRSSRLESLDDCHKRLFGTETSSPLHVHTEAYDEVGVSSELSDEEELYLSDDDDFDNMNGDLSRICLPPHLQAMYGISLLNAHSYAFLAQKFLNDSLGIISDTNTNSDTFNSCLDVGLLSEKSWVAFYHHMTRPLNRMSMFALVASNILRTKTINECAQNLSPLFNRFLSGYEQNILSSQSNRAVDNSEYLTIFLAHFRIEVFRANKMRPSSYGDQHDDDGWNILYTVISKLISLKDYLFQPPDFKARLNSLSKESLKVIAEFYVVVASRWKFFPIINRRTQDDFLSKIFHIVNWFSHVPISVDSEENESSKSINSVLREDLPFAHTWQTKLHRNLSRLVHNLCVSCSISAFSGWEREEFQLRLLRFRSDHSFFGVTLSDNRVSGILVEEVARQLTVQWIELREIIPSISLDFAESLSVFQKTEWYMDVLSRRDTYSMLPIDQFGEESALITLLSLSNICIQLVKTVRSNCQETEHFLKLGLSIILPATQFGLNRTIWSSSIGLKSTELETDGWKMWSGWKITDTIGSSRDESVSNGISKPRLRVPAQMNKTYEPKSTIARKESSDKDDQSAWYKLIQIPVSWLHSEWINAIDSSTVDEISVDDPDSSLEKSLIAMKELDAAVEQLMSCSTVISLQRTSLKIAVALLNVAASVYCYNPFLCLYHAAIFASQASKGGKNDEPFRKILPPQQECTPREALAILGRADCLQAIYFIDEAIFLCSYVAEVLSLHRHDGGARPFKTSKWRVVGIHMYTCSVAIKASFFSLTDLETKRNNIQSWTHDVENEINEARKDAIDLSISHGESTSGPESVMDWDNSLILDMDMRLDARSEDLQGKLDSQPYTNLSYHSSTLMGDIEIIAL